MRMMRILAVGYIAVALNQALSGIMRGAGDAMTPMWISMISTVVIRVPLAYLMVSFTKSDIQPQGAPESIFVSLLISWCLGALITFLAYMKGNWKTKSLQK